MTYSLNKITSQADCDTLIQVATKERDDLQYRKTTVTYQNTNFAKTADEVEAELTSTTAEVSALSTLVVGLPAGQSKDNNTTKLKRLELKAFLLSQKKENYGFIALLQNQMEQATIEAQLAEVDAFIAAITAHKATLAA